MLYVHVYNDNWDETIPLVCPESIFSRIFWENIQEEEGFCHPRPLLMRWEIRASGVHELRFVPLC